MVEHEDDIEAKWAEREERLGEERKRANRIGIIAVVAVLVLSIGACVWYSISRGNAAEEERRAAEVAASGVDTATVPAEDDSEYPPDSFEVGDEVRVSKEGVNQRKEPNTESAVVTTLDWPQHVRIMERQIPEGDEYVWYLVVSWDGTNEGPRGWVREDLLERD